MAREAARRSRERSTEEVTGALLSGCYQHLLLLRLVHGWRELAVGVRYNDDGGSDEGAVYVLFLGADGGARSHAKLSQLTVPGLGLGSSVTPSPSTSPSAATLEPK